MDSFGSEPGGQDPNVNNNGVELELKPSGSPVVQISESARSQRSEFAQRSDGAMQNSLWIDRKEYPFTSNLCPARGGKMHYVDVGHGPVLLMVHGTPTWSFLFRRLIAALSPHFRCIAPDHL